MNKETLLSRIDIKVDINASVDAYKSSLLIYICTIPSAYKYSTPKKGLSQYLNPISTEKLT